MKEHYITIEDNTMRSRYRRSYLLNTLLFYVGGLMFLDVIGFFEVLTLHTSELGMMALHIFIFLPIIIILFYLIYELRYGEMNE